MSVFVYNCYFVLFFRHLMHIFVAPLCGLERKFEKNVSSATKSLTTAIHAQTSYCHLVNCFGLWSGYFAAAHVGCHCSGFPDSLLSGTLSSYGPANPPDPMSCVLAAALLQGSRAHDYRVQKTLFPGSALHACRSVDDRGVPAYRVLSYGVRGRRGSKRGPECLSPIPGSRIEFGRSRTGKGSSGGRKKGVV